MPQHWGMGTPEPQHQTHTATRHPHGPNEAQLFIQCGSMGRDLRAGFEFLTPTVPKPLVHTPLPQRPHLSLPLCFPHCLLIGSASLLGANTNTRVATMGPSQGAWPRNTGYWRHPKINDRLTLLQATRWAQWGAAAHSVRENGQGPLSTWRHLKAPRAKTVGPSVPFPKPSPRPATLITTEHLAQVCGPHGG